MTLGVFSTHANCPLSLLSTFPIDLLPFPIQEIRYRTDVNWAFSTLIRRRLVACHDRRRTNIGPDIHRLSDRMTTSMGLATTGCCSC